MSGMLNDLSRFTRATIFVQTFATGIILGAIVALSEVWQAALIMLGVGLVVMVGWSIGVMLVTRRFDTRLRRDIVRASTDIVADPARASRAPGRVVRRRVAARWPGFVLGQAAAASTSAVVLVVTVLDGDTARRAAALIPAQLGLHIRRGEPVQVALHPTDLEVAVLDDVVTRADLAALDADPRWQSVGLPTDRSVTGGWPGIVLAAVLGLGAGLAVDLLVAALVG